MKDLGLTTPGLIALLREENDRQIAKWGIQDRDSFEWLGFALEELGETSDAISEHRWRGGKSDHVIKEAIQVATLCLKIAEMYKAKEFTITDESTYL